MKRILLLLLALALVGAGSLIWIAQTSPHAKGYFERTPRELAQYVLHRGEGNHALIKGTASLIATYLFWADRGPESALELPTPTWTGARSERSLTPLAPSVQTETVGTISELERAMAGAQAGTHIVLKPGLYTAHRSLSANASGSARNPIVVKAEQLGGVTLRLRGVDGIHVRGPHWHFENLVVEGDCAEHNDCEHAFHVVGSAHHTVIRNNILRNFNSAIKVNGYEDGRAPDDGELAWNTIHNTELRRADRPTNPVDIVAASRWHVHHNHVADYGNENRKKVSHGIFAKGGAENTIIESNTVYCEQTLKGNRDPRVGISFGGGGTGASYCRGGRKCADGEHLGGVMRNNLVVGCTEVGVYLNRARHAVLEHNTLIDTAGIVVRFADSSARLSANFIDGPLRERDGGTAFVTEDNESDPWWAAYLSWQPQRWAFQSPLTGNFRWSHAPKALKTEAHKQIDLCNSTSTTNRRPGAFEDFNACVKVR